jgi:hypothetical protein
VILSPRPQNAEKSVEATVVGRHVQTTANQVIEVSFRKWTTPKNRIGQAKVSKNSSPTLRGR